MIILESIYNIDNIGINYSVYIHGILNRIQTYIRNNNFMLSVNGLPKHRMSHAGKTTASFASTEVAWTNSRPVSGYFWLVKEKKKKRKLGNNSSLTRFVVSIFRHFTINLCGGSKHNWPLVIGHGVLLKYVENP